MGLFKSWDEIANEGVLFFDVESAPAFSSFAQMPEPLQQQWLRLAARLQPQQEAVDDAVAEALYQEKAGIFAEFARVVCISFGMLIQRNGDFIFRIKSCLGNNEIQILQEFARVLDNDRIRYLCAHNGREFDVPFLGRRYLINNLPVPKKIDLRLKRPWDEEARRIIDTMELWSFGDRKSFTRLELLCAVFNIPSPKLIMSGAQVGDTFWHEQNLDKIAAYCESDVLATARLYMRYARLPLITDAQVECSDPIRV